MCTALVRLPTEASSSSSPTLPPSKKPSKRNLSKFRPSPVPAVEKPTDRKNPSRRRHPDSPILAATQIRSNARNSDSRDIIMEEVRILKRGELVRPLSPPLSSGGRMENENPMPCLTDRLGPDPMSVPWPSVPAYAGPAFISSPSPSSLPVPFFLKKAASRGEDVATRSLRCLLRLDASL